MQRVSYLFGSKERYLRRLHETHMFWRFNDVIVEGVYGQNHSIAVKEVVQELSRKVKAEKNKSRRH
jgi:hypothetical protein